MESNKTAYTYLVATVAFALCFFAMCEAPAIISLLSFRAPLFERGQRMRMRHFRGAGFPVQVVSTSLGPVLHSWPRFAFRVGRLRPSNCSA